MIVFGWGDGAKQLGEGFYQVCDNCNNTNRFIVAEVSKKASVYFVPVAKWGRRYFYVCPVCNSGFRVPSKELACRIISAAFRDPANAPENLKRRITEARNAEVK